MKYWVLIVSLFMLGCGGGESDDAADSAAAEAVEAAEEAAADTLDAPEALFLGDVFRLALAGQRQDAVIHADVHVVGIDAWNIGTQDEAVFLLDDVDGWRPAGDRVLVVARAEARVCDAVEIAM